MTESAKSNDDVPLEASIPEGAVPLESILCTEDLHRRPWRPPDYEKENRALVALAIALADSPRRTWSAPGSPPWRSWPTASAPPTSSAAFATSPSTGVDATTGRGLAEVLA